VKLPRVKKKKQGFRPIGEVIKDVPGRSTGFRYLGRPLPRSEGPDKVTGRCLFSADVSRPGALWGKILRSPFPHARILNIDLSRARSLPGVRAIITAQRISPRLVGAALKDVPVLAGERVLFVGDRVAAVAAIDQDIAEEALSLIQVEYEELPAVFDPLEALEPGAPLLHPGYGSYEIGDPRAKDPRMRNVQSVVRAQKGDIDQGFSESDFIFEHRFQTQRVHQGYIEPTAYVVEVDREGRVNVYGTDQSPFSVRDKLMDYLDLPQEKVVLHPVTVGGSFGAKGYLVNLLPAYYLARATGCPVKMVKSYSEELMAGSPRHPSVLFLKSGVKRDGRLSAYEARVIYNGGAYGGFKHTPNAHLNGGLNQGGAYCVPHTRIESLCVYTNEVPGGYMRASGELQTVFAIESHMDMIARELGIDPLEFRLLNAMAEGDTSYTGFRYRDVKCREVLLRAREFWKQPKLPPRRRSNSVGRGIALACRKVSYGEAGAELLLQLDGSLRLILGILDQGAGVHVVQKQIVAEILGVDPETIVVEVGDTNHAPYHDGIRGQCSTHVIGQAVARAATALIDGLKGRAAKEWNVEPREVEWRDGRARLEKEKRRFDLVRLAQLDSSQAVRGYGHYKGEGKPREHIFQAEIADIEVDPETGQVEVRQMCTFHDVSVVLNPLTHQGQIEGGLVQGLGMALCEEVAAEEGTILTLNLGDYKIPAISDIPRHKTILITAATQGPGPFNAKPAAEHSITPVPPAVANAVFDATGVRITELPITGERVLRGLNARRAT
jgi:carbon-monoxide dehydrogenase large subunit